MGGRSTLYEVLQVAEDATLDEIKASYRALAKKLHPDHNKGSEESTIAFRRIDRAYKVLRDVAQRAGYDAKLARLREEGRRAPPSRTQPTQSVSDTSRAWRDESVTWRWGIFGILVLLLLRSCT